MTTDFTHLLRVRYAECDAQGVVFNAKYLEYADIANTEYIRVTTGGFQLWLERGFENQVVSATLNWKAPARFDDVLAIGVRTTKIGNTSLVIQYDFRNHDTGEELLTADLTYVMVAETESGYQKIPVPDDIREAFMKGGQGAVVDHAGPNR